MTGDKHSILIVDDTPENRDLLSRRIAQLGHDTAMAEDGQQALEMLRAAPAAYDLVLLDIMMPRMSGFEVLEQMKADDALRHVPVIVISALSDLDSVVRCVQLGAEDYLFKPFNNVLLKARVGACLEKKQLHDREQAFTAQLQAERDRSERLLLSIFPQAIAERLKTRIETVAENYTSATILFADVHGFSHLATTMKPLELVGLLNTVFSAFDKLAERFGVDKIKTIGDAYMAAAGVPRPRADHAEAIADLALAMQHEIARLTTGLREPLSLRIGIDTGPVVAGVIGTTRFAYDLWGATVSGASQMESFGLPGGIQVTAAVHAILKGRYLLEERGGFFVAGQGEVTTYLLKGKRGK